MVHPDPSVPYSWTMGEKPWRNLPVLWWWALEGRHRVSFAFSGASRICQLLMTVTVGEVVSVFTSCQALLCCILPLKASTMSTRAYMFRDLEAPQGSIKKKKKKKGKGSKKKRKLECQPSLLYLWSWGGQLQQPGFMKVTKLVSTFCVVMNYLRVRGN